MCFFFRFSRVWQNLTITQAVSSLVLMRLQSSFSTVCKQFHKHVCTRRNTHSPAALMMKLDEMRVDLKKVSLLLLIIVTTLSGKPLISGRKRLWASGEMKIGNIDSSHLYGEMERAAFQQKSTPFQQSSVCFWRLDPWIDSISALQFINVWLYEKADPTTPPHNTHIYNCVCSKPLKNKYGRFGEIDVWIRSRFSGSPLTQRRFRELWNPEPGNR